MTSDVTPIVGSSKPERTSGIILAALIAVVFALVAERAYRVASGPPPPRPGVVAPAFAGPSLTDGSTVQLSDLRGKVVLVDFWATWCPPCVASMPTLDKLHRELGPRGFMVLGVNEEPGDEISVRAFMRERNLSLPVIVDPGTIASSYGVFSFPTSMLVGRDGTVRAVHRGPASEATLRAEIEAALSAEGAAR